MILGSEEDFNSRRRCPSCRYGAARATDTKQEDIEGTIYKITYTLISCSNCKTDSWVESHTKDDYEKIACADCRRPSKVLDKQETEENVFYEYYCVSCKQLKKRSFYKEEEQKGTDYKTIGIKKTGHSLSRNFYKGTTGKMAY